MLHLVSITKYFGLLCSEFYYFIVRCDTDHDMVFILFSHKKKTKRGQKKDSPFQCIVLACVDLKKDRLAMLVATSLI